MLLEYWAHSIAEIPPSISHIDSIVVETHTDKGILHTCTNRGSEVEIGRAHV